MVTIFQKGQLSLAIVGEYEWLLLLSLLTFLIRSILHDPKIFNNPMEYQPERYLKDGKLNSDVMDPDTVAFGYGRRSVIDSIYFWVSLYISSPPVFVLENT